MNTPAPHQRWLDPGVLMQLGNIELVARAAVEGLTVGLHRSPRFGFSQEFAEYRPYAEGDDPRFIDWNVYARTERNYVKRFLGETNTRLMIVLDASASMDFGEAGQNKLRYARFLAASLAYLASRQHDAIGLVAFDQQVREFVPPSSRPGRLNALLHAIDRVEAAGGTDFVPPFERFQQATGHRGLVAVISDFLCDVDTLVEAVMPMALQGHDVFLLQLLHPEELNPTIPRQGTSALRDMEDQHTMEVSSRFLKHEYPQRLQAHIDHLRSAAAAARCDHLMMTTDQRLDVPLRRYLRFRQRRG
ncbi:MAG: DUF58 domain-containing protein [Xanthomonadales bacterium]|nr:DUF58 domain-containing protein [Xanthomonadales bacterium]